MDATFACPECGSALKLRGLSPGRQVQCSWCEARVEVPYLPRAARARAYRNRGGWRQRWLGPPLAWGAVGVLALVLLTFGTAHWFQSRSRSARATMLAELIASARADERAGRIGPALATLDAAVALARADHAADADRRVAALLEQRDQLSRSELKVRIAALAASTDPRRTIGECLTLLARIESEPQQADLEAEVRAPLVRAGRASIAADLAAAARDFEANQPSEAFLLCERVARTIDYLPSPERRESWTEANSLVIRIIEKDGVVYDPIRGQFTLGSIASYTTALVPLLSDGLRPHGYLPCPAPSSPWAPLWEKHAPYHVAVAVVEREGGTYQQSLNRITWIEARPTLSHQGVALWQPVISVRTRPALTKLSGYRAARVETNVSANPDSERLLYQDAYAACLERFAQVLRSAPECGTGLAPAPPAATSLPSPTPVAAESRPQPR